MKKKTAPEQLKRKVDQYFDEYNQISQQAANSLMVYVSIIFMLFGLIAVVWAIPFPHLQFLGRYNGFVNWASFLIAVMIYYYLRLSPTLSYLTLFLLFGFSYGIIQLEYWQKAGGMQLWLVGLIALSFGIILYSYTLRKANSKKLKPVSFTAFHHAPLWMIVAILKKLRIGY